MNWQIIIFAIVVIVLIAAYAKQMHKCFFADWERDLRERKADIERREARLRK